MTLTEYEVHPAANIFPMVCDADLKALADDIKANGLQNFGTLFEGKILDGRNRAKACEIAGVTMQFFDASEMEGAEEFNPLAYVLSQNLHRRHLSASQRAACAAEVARLRVGSNQHPAEGGQNCPPSISDAATAFKVSPSSVKTAKKVLDKGAPEVVALVKSGELPVSVAAEFVSDVHDKEYQASIAKQGAQAVRNVITVTPTKATHEGSYCKTCQDPVDAPSESQADINTRLLRELKEAIQAAQAIAKKLVDSADGDLRWLAGDIIPTLQDASDYIPKKLASIKKRLDWDRTHGVGCELSKDRR